jgi:tetrapyrrole methylase family protein/MazG family protein
MARQRGDFAIEDVFAHAGAKLIRRHPHVFANLHVDGEGAVLRNWEQIKAAELAAKGRTRASLLDGVPMALPALAAAQALGKKAARAGFNWTELDQVWAKLHEELDELAAAVAIGSRSMLNWPCRMPMPSSAAAFVRLKRLLQLRRGPSRAWISLS